MLHLFPKFHHFALVFEVIVIPLSEMYKPDKSIKILTLLEGTAYELHLMILHSLLSVVSSTAVKNAGLKQDIFHGKLPLTPLTRSHHSTQHVPTFTRLHG